MSMASKEKMSCNDSENVELGRLTPTEKDSPEDDHQEEECEEEDEKEGREEEMSLLGVEDSPVCPPVQIVISDRRNSGPAVIIPNPSHQLHVLTPSLTPSTNTDPDIQLAMSDPEKVWSVTTMPPTYISSLQSVCGPKPAKLTTICMAMLSIWAMVVLIIHLEKKVSAVSTTLSRTEDKLRTMEDTASSYRLKTQQRLQNMQQKLSVILEAVDTGSNHDSVRKTKTKKPKSVQTATSLPPDVTKPGDEENVTKPGDEDDNFFGSNWSLW